MADPNPKPHPGIISLIINVKCEDYHFDVQAWDHETQEGYTCNGGADDDSKALLNEILGKIQAAFPRPIKLCIRDKTDIVRYVECAPAPAAAVPFGIPMAGVAAAIVVPDRFENTVVFASVDSDRESKTPPIYAFDVDFKKPMPNGSGTMEITIKNRVYKFPLQIYHGPKIPGPIPEPEDEPVGPGKQTRRFRLVWDPSVNAIPGVTKKRFPAAVVNQPVIITPGVFRPTDPSMA